MLKRKWETERSILPQCFFMSSKIEIFCSNYESKCYLSHQQDFPPCMSRLYDNKYIHKCWKSTQGRLVRCERWRQCQPMSRAPHWSQVHWSRARRMKHASAYVVGLCRCCADHLTSTDAANVLWDIGAFSEDTELCKCFSLLVVSFNIGTMDSAQLFFHFIFYNTSLSLSF